MDGRKAAIRADNEIGGLTKNVAASACAVIVARNNPQALRQVGVEVERRSQSRRREVGLTIRTEHFEGALDSRDFEMRLMAGNQMIEGQFADDVRMDTWNRRRGATVVHFVVVVRGGERGRQCDRSTTARSTDVL